MALTQESTDTHDDEARETRLVQPEPQLGLRDTDEGLRVMPFQGFSIYQEWARRDEPAGAA